VHISLIADSHFGSVSFGFLRILIAVQDDPSNKALKISQIGFWAAAHNYGAGLAIRFQKSCISKMQILCLRFMSAACRSRMNEPISIRFIDMKCLGLRSFP